MADLLYTGGLPVEADGLTLFLSDSVDFHEIPDLGDVSVSGATTTPTTIRTTKRVIKRAGKPSPVTFSGQVMIWRPDLTPCALASSLLASQGKALAKVQTGPEEVLQAKGAAHTFAIAATTGKITVAGTGAASFDWTDWDEGSYLKFGSTAADYVRIDRIVDSANAYAKPATMKAAAQADIVAAQIESEPVLVHVTEAPGSSVTFPGSQDGGLANSTVTFEAVDANDLDWVVVPKA